MAQTRWIVTGPAGADSMSYLFVPGTSPLHAVAAVHREALGTQAVWIWDGQIRFADAAMQDLCAGTWHAQPHIPNGRRRLGKVVIAPPERG
jgi:hypothetical protein